jgi:threonine/homoserine/homoserine lactone efflux protein
MKRAWNTSEMAGTAGLHAHTHSRLGSPGMEKIVQDTHCLLIVDCGDERGAPAIMGVTEFLALLTFAATGSGSPGPNNTLLLASGVRFGFRRTLPHVVGTAAGIGALVVAVAAGLGVALDTFPAARLLLRIAGSAYLLYIAFRLSSGQAFKEASISKPLNLWEAVVFQFLNPKGWVFSIAVVSTFLPPGLSAPIGGLIVAATLTIVVAVTASIWALGGVALRGLVAGDRSRRVLSLVLAALMTASVVFLWI